MSEPILEEKPVPFYIGEEVTLAGHTGTVDGVDGDVIILTTQNGPVRINHYPTPVLVDPPKSKAKDEKKDAKPETVSK